MKKLLLAAIVLSTATAFATRSRVTALGNSPHIIDTAISSPDQLLPLAETLTIESGVNQAVDSTQNFTGATTFTSVTNTAEGSLYKNAGDGRFGLVLGHQDAWIYSMRRIAANTPALTNNLDGQQNPLGLNYAMRAADLNVGFGLIYSNYADKTATDEKESSMGIHGGVSNSMFYGNAKIIFTDSYKLAANEYKGKMGLDLKGGYYFGDMSVHANYVMGGFKTSDATTTFADVEVTKWNIKLIDTIKKDSNLFYGIGLASTSAKEKQNTPNSKSDTMSLPLIIGLETPAASWLTFRGSVTQDVLISKTKIEGTGLGTATDVDPGTNTTTFAAGAGLVFNKVTIDGSVIGTAQTINAGNLLGTVGVSYMF